MEIIMIYADNAATTKMDHDVFEVMKCFLEEEYGNASQPYSFSKCAKNALKNSRNTIAELIGALPEEIFFTSGGSESDNWAIKGTMLPVTNRNEMITSEIEHHAVLNAANEISKLGCKIKYLHPNKEGIISETNLANYISHDTKLVSIMLGNNEIGTLEPISKLANITHNYGALFHTDAVQVVGHLPISVTDLRVDLMSASAHKFNGPKGVGFLFIKKGTQIGSLINGGIQEFGLRAGTENVAGIVGMAKALKNNIDNMSKDIEHIKRVEMTFMRELSNSGLVFQRNGINQIPGNVSISFKNQDGELLLHRLDLMGIYISTGSACDSVNTQVSHVLKAIEKDSLYVEGTIRVSFGKNNTEDDARAIVNALYKIIKE